jgi:hypothetical protein
MVKLDARIENGRISISDDSFEHLLNCLDNQKFINEAPPNGDALSMGKSEYQKIQDENQACIDDFNKQCRDLWLSSLALPLSFLICSFTKTKKPRKEKTMNILDTKKMGKITAETA